MATKRAVRIFLLRDFIEVPPFILKIGKCLFGGGFKIKKRAPIGTRFVSI
jgi:hypothetical protein